MYTHENFIKTVSSLYPQGAWLDVQRNSSQYFSTDGKFAYFYNDCLMYNPALAQFATGSKLTTIVVYLQSHLV